MADIFVSVKRKLTERKSSSSSESNSPEGKRTKDENEDEVLRALNMADDMAGKLDKIIAQLRKLDSIETTLNEICNKVAKIEGEVKKLQSDTSLMDGKVKGTETKVEEMDKGLTWLNEQVEQIQSKIKKMEDTKEKEFSELHSKQLYAEAYSRRENPKFFGIPETETTSSAEQDGGDTHKVLCQFINNVLGFEDPANRIEFQRVHRIGKVKPEKPRPIIARFLRFSDRERVLRAGFQLNKDTGFKILEDFPQEIINRRRSQMSRLMEAKKAGKKVSFSRSEPDKLYINSVYVPA